MTLYTTLDQYETCVVCGIDTYPCIALRPRLPYADFLTATCVDLRVPSFRFGSGHNSKPLRPFGFGVPLGQSKPRKTRRLRDPLGDTSDYHPKGLEPKGSRVTDMGFVSGSPETALQPQLSTFLVRTSFLSPKGAGQASGQLTGSFKKSGFQSIENNGRCHVLMPPAAAMDDMPRTHCLIFCVFQLCVTSLS